MLLQLRPHAGRVVAITRLSYAQRKPVELSVTQDVRPTRPNTVQRGFSQYAIVCWLFQMTCVNYSWMTDPDHI